MKKTTAMPLTAIMVMILLSIASVSNASLVHNTNLPYGIYGMASVPEPATLIVLIIGGLAVLGAKIGQRHSKSQR